MRVKPFSYLEQKDVGPPPVPTFPLVAESIHRYEDVYTNLATSTTVTDLVTGNANMILRGGAYADPAEFIQTLNTSTLGYQRTQLASVDISATISGNRDCKSFIILEEHEDDSVFTSTSDNIYLADFRGLNNYFGSYMTDKDSILISTNTNSRFDGGEQFVYVPGNPVYQSTMTQATFTDGAGRVGGGDDYYQWAGNSPASRGPSGFRRLWGFNFITGKGFNTSTNGGTGYRYAIYGKSVSSLDQGSSGKIWAHALFDVPLTITYFNQLIAYYKYKGYIT